MGWKGKGKGKVSTYRYPHSKSSWAGVWWPSSNIHPFVGGTWFPSRVSKGGEWGTGNRRCLAYGG